MKAISYLRFSTPEQKFGNSTERQLKITRDYCARNGLELDEELSIADEGLSGYHGHHVEKGSLGHFLNEIKAGKIPAGTALVIENLDRISRQGPKIARKIIEQIVDNGVEVHIANISTRLTHGSENDPTRSIIVDIELGRALKESEYKSNRIGSAWRSKREKIESGKAYSGHVPAWLKVVDEKIVEIPEIVEHVRKVFKMSAQGVGAVNIWKLIGGEVTNDDNKPFSLTWYQRLLNDRSVLGEFTPKGCETIPNYFPQIIAQSDFDAAREVISAKNKNGRCISGKRDSLQAGNLFPGLLYDVPMTSPLRLKKTGSQSYRLEGQYSFEDSAARSIHFQKCDRGTYLRSARSIDRKQNAIRYDVVEESILRFLKQEDWASVAGQTESDECKAARAELETLLREIDVTARRIKRDTAAMDSADMDIDTAKVFARRLAKDEAALETLKSRKDDLQANVERACRRCESLYNPERMLELIAQNTESAQEVRMRLRAEIRKAVARIGLIFVQDKPLVIAVIEYVNDFRRYALINTRDNQVLLLQEPDEQP